MTRVLHVRPSPTDPKGSVELTLVDPYTGVVEADLDGVTYGWDHPSNDLEEVKRNFRKGDRCPVQRHVVHRQTRIDVDKAATKVRFVDDGSEHDLTAGA